MRLKWRVFGYLLGFCFLLLIILWLFQIVFLNNFYRHIRITEIRNNASIIISRIDDEDILETVLALAEDGNFTADIVNLRGWTVIGNSRPTSLDIEINTTLISRALENGGEFYEYSSEPPNSINRFAPARQLDGCSRPYGETEDRWQPYRQFIRQSVESLVYVRLVDDKAVIISAVVTPVHATVTTLRYQLYMISAIMLISAVILALVIAKRVSKPIEKINHNALDLAKGRYNTRFSGKGFNEIVELSETLNTAAIELGKTETLRRELLANVSHDLRTPLALIYSYAEMMHDFPKEITGERVTVIMEESRRLSGLVNDVLDISKLEANMELLNISSFNFTKSIKETVERLQELLKNQNYIIDFNFDKDIMIKADETKINRAFYNLLVNAINYAGVDRKVSV
ncbi:MAG: HAMP domain-containing histidine kinase, partial [Treponema sp.]|nr:HAMP domain-containing histidine kinase [Treponema sp.]